jgi:hypothetical protein
VAGFLENITIPNTGILRFSYIISGIILLGISRRRQQLQPGIVEAVCVVAHRLQRCEGEGAVGPRVVADDGSHREVGGRVVGGGSVTPWTGSH